MKKRIFGLLMIFPLIIIFIVYGISDTIKLIIDLNVEYIELEHKPVEEVYLNSVYELFAKAYPLSAQNNEIIWTSSDESIAKIIDGKLHTFEKEGLVTITASLRDNSVPAKSFSVYVVSQDKTPKYIAVYDTRMTETSLSEDYYYGLYRFDGNELVKDTISLNIKVIPASANQEIEIDTSENITFDEHNKIYLHEPGDFELTIRSKEKRDVTTLYRLNVIDGVNVYSYSDLIKCTNHSENGEVVVLQTNLESEQNLSRSNSALCAYLDEQGNKSFSYDEIESTYDTLFYTNSGLVPPKLKVGVHFKQNVYGNGFTINLHELCFPKEIQAGTKKPIPGLNDFFQGPLMFISAVGLTVYGQDNIGFLVNGDNIKISNITLKNANNVSDLTHLDYVGTTLEIMGDNVHIKDSIIANGRTVVRSFSNENLLIEGSLLQYAREFILKVGSNSIVRATSVDNLYPHPMDKDGNTLSDTSCVIKNSFFYTSGIFCIGIDTHFSGPLLYDGTAYVSGAYDLAATSYASRVTLEGDIRFYDWKKISSLDSSTLISGYNEKVSFDIGEMILSIADDFPILKNLNNEVYIHGGIAFFGGGLNLSEISFLNNELSQELLYFNLDLNSLPLSAIIASAAGDKPFKFYVYPSTYKKIDINEKPMLEDLKVY